MIAEANIPHGGKAGAQSSTCEFGSLQQRDRRRLLFHGCDHIGFSAQTEVDMTIDETGEDRQATAVDALRAFGETDCLVGPDGRNAITVNYESAALQLVAPAVENADMANGNRHGASLIGMVTMTPPMMSLSL
jgi:hypothetical protein